MMNLIRLIAIAALFWLLYRLILSLLEKARHTDLRRRSTDIDEEPDKGGIMVRCEQCGLHVPKGEALERDGKFYCCEEHRDADDSWKRDE